MLSKQRRLVQRPNFVMTVTIILFAAVLAIGLAFGDDRFSSQLSGGGGPAPAAVDAAIGATVEPLNRTTAESLGIAPESEGLVVTSLGRSRPAERAGIKAGDVIVRIGGAPVSSVRDAAAALEHAPDLTDITLNRSGHYAIVQLPVRALDRRDPVEEGAAR